MREEEAIEDGRKALLAGVRTANLLKDPVRAVIVRAVAIVLYGMADLAGRSYVE